MDGLPGDVLYFHRAGIAKIVWVVDLHARLHKLWRA